MKKTIIHKLFAFILTCTVLISSFSLFASAAALADGKYEVNIYLWHSEDDKKSMAASSFEEKATIIVKNGVAVMHIKTGKMTMGPISASLQELRIADSQGDYTDATVETRNSDGDPTGFYFTMPHQNEYITVKVNPHIAMMGNRDIGARIKVDYSSLKLISKAEATSQNSESATKASVTEKAEEITKAGVTEAVTDGESTTVAAEKESAEEVITETAESVSSENEDETLNHDSENAEGKKKDSKFPWYVIPIALVLAVVLIVIIKKKK